jgi:glucose/arabinose dehydrogenase
MRGGRRIGGRGAFRVAVGTAVAVAGLCLWLGGGSRALGGSSGLALKRIGTFDTPVYVDNAPGARRLLFVVEEPGRIEVVRRGHVLSHPFLDITGRVNFDGAERGLFSVAFAPNYRKSRRFYVYFTNAQADNEVDEFKRSRRSRTRARVSSRRRVLLIPHPPDENHNGGQLQFGPDGRLYIGTGDGGCSNDCHDNARNLDVLLGKLLRIDPRRRNGHPYTVPRGNPFVGKPGRDEIYSYGLRNPWRFSFDSANGNLALADVGQDQVEEVDYTARAGARSANFGWPEWEGNVRRDPSRPGPGPPTPPIFTYTHSGTGGCAVIGGYVVHSRGLSSLNGRYLYSDLCNGDVRSFVPATGGATGDRSTGLHLSSPTSFGQGARGRIYVASQDGPVYKLVRK